MFHWHYRFCFETSVDDNASILLSSTLPNFLYCFSGTMYAACELMKKQNVEVMGCMVVIELNGVEKLKPNTLFSLV